MGIPLVSDASLACVPGDFGVRLSDGRLFLSEPVYALARQAGLADLGADAFVGSVLLHFPNSCAATLGWNRTDYDRAVNALRDLLRPHLSERTLNPEPPPQFATGALIPGSRDNAND